MPIARAEIGDSPPLLQTVSPHGPDLSPRDTPFPPHAVPEIRVPYKVANIVFPHDRKDCIALRGLRDYISFGGLDEPQYWILSLAGYD